MILEIKKQSTPQTENILASKVIELIRAHEMEKQTEYISFSMNVCKELKRLAPDAVVAYLGGDVDPQTLKDEGLTGLDYNASVFDKHPEWIDEAHKLGLTVNVWTVNKREAMTMFIRKKADFITTDNPLDALELSATVK
jgi:glycerophosphoryl diester phosphodiesterase